MKRAFKVGVGVAAVILVTSAAVHAHEVGSVRHWQGTGKSFHRSGPEESGFTVDLVRTQVAEGVVEVKGTVVLDDGKSFGFTQRETQGERGFRIEGDRGNGGGRCFGEGLCETYVESEDGKAFATTVVIDPDDRLRLLVTELKNGQAVRFIRQSLKRVQ